MWEVDFIDSGNWGWIQGLTRSQILSMRVPPALLAYTLSCQVQKQASNRVSLAWLKYISDTSMARNL